MIQHAYIDLQTPKHLAKILKRDQQSGLTNRNGDFHIEQMRFNGNMMGYMYIYIYIYTDTFLHKQKNAQGTYTVYVYVYIYIDICIYSHVT